MRDFKFFEALGELGSYQSFLGFNGYVLTGASATGFTLTDPEGDGVTFTGTGLTFDDVTHQISGGTVQRARIFSAADDTLLVMSGLRLDGADFYDYSTGLGPNLFFEGLRNGNDRLIGSDIADYLFGDARADTLIGNDGADYLRGGKGDDYLLGGEGVDHFLFGRNEGHDLIMGFSDLDRAQDDVIAITRNLYRTMDATQTSGGVELHFGLRGTVLIQSMVLADLDRADFDFAF